MLTVHQFPCLSDNYGFLIRDEASGKTACIDTPDAAAILRELEQLGWGLDLILNTHWHPDHAAPVPERPEDSYLERLDPIERVRYEDINDVTDADINVYGAVATKA